MFDKYFISEQILDDVKTVEELSNWLNGLSIGLFYLEELNSIDRDFLESTITVLGSYPDEIRKSAHTLLKGFEEEYRDINILLYRIRNMSDDIRDKLDWEFHNCKSLIAAFIELYNSYHEKWNLMLMGMIQFKDRISGDFFDN